MRIELLPRILAASVAQIHMQLMALHDQLYAVPARVFPMHYTALENRHSGVIGVDGWHQ